METHLLGHAIDAMRRHTGVVIPVYFPANADLGLGQALLADNVRAYVQQVDDPARICLSVDGAEHEMEIAEALATECGVMAVCTPENMGKMNGLRHGVHALWGREKREELRYVAAVDSDGDHFANELLNLVRAAVHVQEREGGEVLALGRRSSKHRPMGFLRGELEELADRVLLDALAFRAAKSGEPLRMEYATTHEEYPDFHSGFKLYSRGVVEPVFLGEPELCALEPAAYYRHGCEAVAIVEALLAGCATGTRRPQHLQRAAGQRLRSVQSRAPRRRQDHLALQALGGPGALRRAMVAQSPAAAFAQYARTRRQAGTAADPSLGVAGF